MNFILAALLFFLLPTGDAGAPQPSMVKIEAKRFQYSPNEITLKKGQKATLEIHSDDVEHGLVIPDLQVKVEIRKGADTEVSFAPQQVGTFQGRCSHFCGTGHGQMRMTVHIVE